MLLAAQVPVQGQTHAEICKINAQKLTQGLKEGLPNLLSQASEPRHDWGGGWTDIQKGKAVLTESFPSRNTTKSQVLPFFMEGKQEALEGPSE